MMEMFKFKSHLEKFNGQGAWGHHYVVPDELVQTLKENGIKRLIATINDALKIHCALMPKGDGTYFITVNAETRKKLKMQVGQELEIEIVEDKSKYGLPMPEEFQEVLNQDEIASEIFEKLTPGKQRNLLYIAGKPKNSQKRIEKAIVIADHLMITKGKIDFRMLNEAFKESNRRM